MRACFLDVGSVGNRLEWSKLQSAAQDWRWYRTTAHHELPERIADVDIIVTNKIVIDRHAIAAAPRLKLICLTATGSNNIDLEAAAERDIPVINITGYATAAVSQHVFALILAFATRWADYDAAVARGAWQRAEFFDTLDYPIEELADAVLAVIGYGELGAAVARLGRAFGMQVLIAERPGADWVRAERVSFEHALEAADYLSLHCPLTERTRGLIEASALARMKTTAVLINTARGGVIDSRALIDALNNGVIAGAGVDVLDQEPPRHGHPLIDEKPDNLIITPHTAWASRGARQRALDGVADNIAAFQAGDESRRVN